MAEQNLIPSIKAAGRFEALAPFDKVVDPDKYYSVEAVRTIAEMEGLKIDVFTRVFKPVGVTEADFQTVLTRARNQGAVVVTLLDRGGVPSYVVSTFFKSFPLVDGVSYERMCLIVDLGPCPPKMREVISQATDHIKSYILDTVGVDTNVQLGTIPTLGYTSAQQAEAYEATRKSKITNSNNDISRIRELEALLIKRDDYIARLEAQLK